MDSDCLLILEEGLNKYRKINKKYTPPEPEKPVRTHKQCNRCGEIKERTSNFGLDITGSESPYCVDCIIKIDKQKEAEKVGTIIQLGKDKKINNPSP